MNAEDFNFDVYLISSLIDLRAAREIATRLRREGLKVAFDDPSEVKLKERIHTESTIKNFKKVVICLSKDAIQSDWKDYKPVLPLINPTTVILVLLDDCKIYNDLINFPQIEWREGGRRKDFKKLVKACKESLQTSHKFEHELPFDDQFTPTSNLFLPLTPFDNRMLALGSILNSHPPENSREGKKLKRIMAADIAFQAKLKAMTKKLPHIAYSRMRSQSGLQMAKQLREYFLEYFNRYFNFGPKSFPSSFNVMESFLQFNRERFFFDLRKETEFLLPLDNYMHWYKKSDIPLKTSLLNDLMEEGVVYAYDMIRDEATLIKGEKHDFVCAGISLVRHGSELSCMLLAGEKPPYISDDKAKITKHEPLTDPTRQGLVPDPTLKVDDRYLKCYPDYAKVVILTRIDIEAQKYGVRYANLDTGQAYAVFTDDSALFEGLPHSYFESKRQYLIDGLKHYETLYSALSSLIFLPVYVAAHPERNEKRTFGTELSAEMDNGFAKKTIKELHKSEIILEKEINFISDTANSRNSSFIQIKPPTLEFKSDGYWKPIGPQEIGNGKNGEPIFGKTWVSKHESWFAQNPKTFMVEHIITDPTGPDPGIVYIQRSPSHEPGVFKIGLTRKDVHERAKGLSSSTSTPLPFAVLVHWKVGDCSTVESRVHQLLTPYRINPNREFFRVDISTIIRTVERVLAS